jgi:D-serine deaminase-like pyridoxal phosphate-dependent protein
MTFQIPCPAEPGMALNEVDTPALLLDLDAFDSNLQRLDTSLQGRKMRVPSTRKIAQMPGDWTATNGTRSGRCVLSESHRS